MFEFDPAKSASNKIKHGIDFVEAQALWRDGQRLELPTRLGAADEERWMVIGRIGIRYWTAIVTYRETSVRLISVRRSRDDEESWYYDQKF